MNTYIHFLSVFLLCNALIYVLVLIPGTPMSSKFSKQNLVFLSAACLACIWKLVMSNGNIPGSYLLSIGFMFLALNTYLLICSKIRGGSLLAFIADLSMGTLTFSTASCLVALIDDVPIFATVLESFENGDYLFKPGHLTEIITSSSSFALLAVTFKFTHYHLWSRWEQLQQYKIDEVKTQKKSLEVQFSALQAKINPHFMYNSLNTIAGLAPVDGEKTRQIALSLSQFFRESMNPHQKMMIPVTQEADMLKTYLEIEKIRFENKLNYSITISDDASLIKLPGMLLQPVIENSIKHGMKGNIDLLTVNISFSILNKILVISVKDNGAPFPTVIAPRYGIQSVYDKLELLLPGKYDIEINTQPEKEFKIYLQQTTS